MKRINVHLFMLLFLVASGCSHARPLVEVPSRSGEIFQRSAVEKTGSRKDVPADKKAREVVSQARLVHAGGSIGKIVITQSLWPWGEVNVDTNCARCHADAATMLTVEQPKRPWYFWPVWSLAFLAAGAAVIFMSHIKRFFAPLTSLFKRR